MALAGPPAYAQDAVLGGYGATGGETQATIEPAAGGPGGETVTRPDNTPVATPSRSSDLLPFTGLDLLLVGAAGIGLVLLGLALRVRMSPPPKTG